MIDQFTLYLLDYISHLAIALGVMMICMALVVAMLNADR